MCAARLAAPCLLLASVIGLGACNVLTGADDILLQDQTTQPVGGTGGVVATGGSGTGGLGGAGPSTGGAGGSSAEGGAGGAGGSPPVECTWPTGPYGVEEGNTLDQSLSWQGCHENEGQVGTVSMQEYFDCDGSAGITAVLFITAALE